MATLYRNAPVVKQIAADLMEEFPHILGHLRGMRVEYLWREKAQKKAQKTVLGTASLISGRHALLALKGGINEFDWADGKNHAFFVIEIAEDEWRHLSEHQRRALVAHELSHCGKDDDDEPMLVGHDLEEFQWVAREFGLWKCDLEAFVNGCAHHAQGTLPFDQAERFNRLDVDETTGELREEAEIPVGRETTVTITPEALQHLRKASQYLRTGVGV